MAHENNSSKGYSVNGSTRESVAERENRIQLHMQATEAKRLDATRCPIILGSLWFCPKLEVVWQIVRIYGAGYAANSAVIELGGVLLTEEDVYWCRRRLTLPDLVSRYIYYGSVHDTTWGK